MIEKFSKDIENLDIKNREDLNIFIDNIDINEGNYNKWIDDVCSKKIDILDMNKLPYIIDKLYVSNEKYQFLLCCMLLEQTYNKLPFITNLENYPISEKKLSIFKYPLMKIYESVDNGIANCMALILLNNDPKLELFDEEEKQIIGTSTIRKLNDIIKYLDNNTNIDSSVYNDLEVIVDLAIYLKNKDINNLIEKLSNYELNYECKLFILKYKILNNMTINNNVINDLLSYKNKLNKLVYVLERIDAINLLPNDINQEEIARAEMINWLEYPTELGKVPDSIELLGIFDYNGYDCYAYKFKSNDFRIKDYMLGVVGGYEKNKITDIDTGWTFSKFELLEDDYIKQALELVEFMNNLWKERNKNE